MSKKTLKEISETVESKVCKLETTNKWVKEFRDYPRLERAEIILDIISIVNKGILKGMAEGIDTIHVPVLGTFNRLPWRTLYLKLKKEHPELNKEDLIQLTNTKFGGKGSKYIF